MNQLAPDRIAEIVPCPECGEPYERHTIMLDTKPLIANRRCGRCAEAAEAQEQARSRAWHADREARDREASAQEHSDRVARCLEDLAVPELYTTAALETFELHGTEDDHRIQLRVKSAGLRYLAEWPNVYHRILILRGEYGTGKGHWIWSVAQRLAEHGESVRVVKLANLIRELRRSWRSPDAESEEVTLARYRALDLLVIDEVSRHAFYGENIHQHLYDVIDDRMEHRRPTILTSNEDHASLRDLLRPALWSRIHGNGGVMEFGTADYRKRPRVIEMQS